MKKFQPSETLPLLVHFLKTNNLPKVAKKLAKHCTHLDDANPLLEMDLHSLVKQHISEDKKLRKKYKKYRKALTASSPEPKIEKKRKESEILYKKEDPLQNYQEAMNGEMNQGEAMEEEELRGAEEKEYEEQAYEEEQVYNKRNEKRAFSRVNVHMSAVKRQLRDNSFHAKKGDQFGQVGQQMLGGKHGKDFKKQKTKLKNKNFHGGHGRSINLEPASVLL